MGPAGHYEVRASYRSVATLWDGTIESQRRNTFHEEINARGTLWVRDHPRYRTVSLSLSLSLCTSPYWQSVKPTVLHRARPTVQLASQHNEFPKRHGRRKKRKINITPRAASFMCSLRLAGQQQRRRLNPGRVKLCRGTARGRHRAVCYSNYGLTSPIDKSFFSANISSGACNSAV